MDSTSWNVVRELSIPVYAEDGAAWTIDGRELPTKLAPLVRQAGGRCDLVIAIRLQGRAEFCRESLSHVASVDHRDVESVTLAARGRNVVVSPPLSRQLVEFLADDIESFCESIGNPSELAAETAGMCEAAS